MATVRNFQISFVVTFRFSDTFHTLYMNKRQASCKRFPDHLPKMDTRIAYPHVKYATNTLHRRHNQS
jgi:hypothetical protein